MTPIEAAARAHWDAKRYSTSRTWEDLKPEERSKAVRHMAAAIEALREPSEAMVEAGAYCIPVGQGEDIGPPNTRDAAECFRAMIDAALSDD